MFEDLQRARQGLCLRLRSPATLRAQERFCINIGKARATTRQRTRKQTLVADICTVECIQNVCYCTKIAKYFKLQSTECASGPFVISQGLDSDLHLIFLVTPSTRIEPALSSVATSNFWILLVV